MRNACIKYSLQAKGDHCAVEDDLSIILSLSASVLEEIFATEDVALQSKLRHALGGKSHATPPRPSSVRPPEHP